MKNSKASPTWWSIKTAPTHPLAEQYGITERQFRRAVQKGRIEYTRPGGLVIRFSDENIIDFIKGARNAPMNRGEKL